MLPLSRGRRPALLSVPCAAFELRGVVDVELPGVLPGAVDLRASIPGTRAGFSRSRFCSCRNSKMGRFRFAHSFHNRDSRSLFSLLFSSLHFSSGGLLQERSGSPPVVLRERYLRLLIPQGF